MTRLRRPATRSLFLLLLLFFTLAACGGDSGEQEDRSFAPEAQGETQLPTNTPAPTSTFEPLDLQPGENEGSNLDSTALFSKTGQYQSVLSGLTEITAVNVDTGDQTSFSVTKSVSVLAGMSPDAQRMLVVDRTGTSLVVRLLDGEGKQLAEWSPPQASSPEASPTSASISQTGDRISWSRDSAHVAIWISGLGLFVADQELKMSPVTDTVIQNVTALTWSPTGQSIGIGLWNSEQRSASIVSIGVGNLDAVPTTVLNTAEGDGRFVRSLAWGNERVGLVFTLRSTGSNMSLPNDLFSVPRFGEPMRLLASAGVAAPAAVIDLVAIADDGSTVAFSVLVPGEVGLRFHSVWVTDATAPRPVRATTIGLRRISEMVWTGKGLVISGTRRTQDDAGTYQVAVVEQISTAEPVSIATQQSQATPVGSPAASPVAATPETDDQD